ncbi:MAG: pyruvate kinase [Polyangiaceae bacterium]|nr:pyruvate kinase [Polyangiaceae bacterium]
MNLDIDAGKNSGGRASISGDAGRPLLIVTIGPNSLDHAEAIENAGADRFRINGSHLSTDDLARQVKRLQSTTRLPIVVDLQGAKIRLGNFSSRQLHTGDTVTLSLDDHRIHREPVDGDYVGDGDGEDIPLPHPEVFRQARPGDTLSCDDDRVRVRVDAVSDDKLTATSLCDAILKSRKGVNVVEHPIILSNLSTVDAEQVRMVSFCPVTFAYSFMLDGQEASWLRDHAANSQVIGKIERREAITNIEKIASMVHEIWICRGDLGAQLGFGDMARWISRFEPRCLSVPVYMAGQVLEHLTNHKHPTRSEVCHLRDLIHRGYAGIVLSDETAIGDDPVNATTVAAQLLRDLV